LPEDPRTARSALSNEWHARPDQRLAAPLRCTHVVELRSGTAVADSRAELAAFCRELSVPGPAEGDRHHSVQLDSCRIKWEAHTEATSHTILAPGNGSPPFGQTALDLLSGPVRDRMLERMWIGVQIEVLRPPGPDDPYGYALARSLLGNDVIYGGRMSAATCAVWSSFRLDASGFQRLVVVTLEEHEGRLSRLIHRLLDLETYRMMAMLALPKAREVMTDLNRLEPQLDAVMAGLAEERDEELQEEALRRITGIAARAEHIVAANAYRFAAARAYAGIVERRSAEVGEEVLESHQRYTNFLSRSLQPAMRTCDAAERRVHDLAERVGRAASLLDTMVDVVQKKQNQSMLESLTQRARVQIQLQQAVEGFSIFAISYYAVGLLAYGLKAAKAAGLAVEPDLVAGLAAPAVLAASWLTVRIVRRRLHLDGEVEAVRSGGSVS